MKTRGEWINTHCPCGCGWQSTVSIILPKKKKISVLLVKCWNYTIYWREGVNFQDSSFEMRGGVCYLWQTIVRFLLKKVTTDLINLESDKKKKKNWQQDKSLNPHQLGTSLMYWLVGRNETVCMSDRKGWICCCQHLSLLTSNWVAKSQVLILVNTLPLPLFGRNSVSRNYPHSSGLWELHLW